MKNILVIALSGFLVACSSNQTQPLPSEANKINLDSHPDLIQKKLVKHTTLSGSNLRVYSPFDVANKCLEQIPPTNSREYLAAKEFSNYLACVDESSNCSHFFDLRNREIINYKTLGNCSKYEVLLNDISPKN